MQKVFHESKMEKFPCDISKLENVENLSDAEIILKLEEMGYPFKRTFQAAPNYIHRKVADMDVLISIGENIANFNGYIELNSSAVMLWEAMSTPKTFAELREQMKQQYELTHEEATADLQEFLTLLQEHNMVTVQ